jgi:hypothetical protein
MDNYAERNASVFTELEALIEKIAYGSLDLKLDVHNKRITKLTVYGQKRSVYDSKIPNKLVKDIAGRLRSALESHEDTKMTFIIETKDGAPKEALWLSELTRNYDRLDSTK